jgi:hypothetical protein
MDSALRPSTAKPDKVQSVAASTGPLQKTVAGYQLIGVACAILRGLIGCPGHNSRADRVNRKPPRRCCKLERKREVQRDEEHHTNRSDNPDVRRSRCLPLPILYRQDHNRNPLHDHRCRVYRRLRPAPLLPHRGRLRSRPSTQPRLVIQNSTSKEVIAEKA